LKQEEQRGQVNKIISKEEGRGGLDCNGRDADYFEVVRAKHFHIVPSKQFVQIYKRKANNISTDDKLTGIRKSIGKLSFLFF